jgi:hypothetical protein
VREYLQSADVFVMSSLWEGFSVALIEAGAMGLPVIATPVGIAPELIVDGKNGLIVPVKNAQAIADAITKLFNLSEEVRKNMGAQLRQDILEKFSVKKMVEQYQGMYESQVIIKKVPLKKRLLIVTTSDLIAGAEKSIYDLLRCINRSQYDLRLVVLKHEEGGDLVQKVKDLGIHAELIGIQSKIQFYKLIQLWKIIKEFRPDILESFLYFDNQIVRVFGKLARVPAVISGQQNAYFKGGWLRNFIDRYHTSPNASHYQRQRYEVST